MTLVGLQLDTYWSSWSTWREFLTYQICHLPPPTDIGHPFFPRLIAKSVFYNWLGCHCRPDFYLTRQIRTLARAGQMRQLLRQSDIVLWSKRCCRQILCRKSIFTPRGKHFSSFSLTQKSEHVQLIQPRNRWLLIIRHLKTVRFFRTFWYCLIVFVNYLTVGLIPTDYFNNNKIVCIGKCSGDYKIQVCSKLKLA